MMQRFCDLSKTWEELDEAGRAAREAEAESLIEAQLTCSPFYGETNAPSYQTIKWGELARVQTVMMRALVANRKEESTEGQT